MPSASSGLSLTPLACPHSNCEEVDLMSPSWPHRLSGRPGGTSTHLPIGFVSLLDCLHPWSPTLAPWDHFLGKPSAYKPCFQVLTSGKPKIKHGIFVAPNVTLCTCKGMNPATQAPSPVTCEILSRPMSISKDVSVPTLQDW